MSSPQNINDVINLSVICKSDKIVLKEYYNVSLSINNKVLIQHKYDNIVVLKS